MPPSWLDLLMDMLCQIYQAWGGDCADLSTNPSKRIGQVIDEYTTEGAPSFPNPTALANFLQLLTDLSDLLDNPANSLSTADTNHLRDLIKDLQTDLGV
jgi:hypothetical protein